MTAAGIPVSRALGTIAGQSGTPALRRAATIARDKIAEGGSLADGLRASDAFPPFVTGMVEVAEDAGAVDDILKELVQYYEWKLGVRRAVIRSIAYPVVLIPVALLLMGVFLRILDNIFGGEALSGFIHTFAVIVAIIAVVIVVALLLRRGAHALVLRAPFVGTLGRAIPIFGTLSAKLATSNFAYSLYLCVRAGVPIIEGLERAAAASGSATMELTARKTVSQIKQGASLREAFASTRVFPQSILEIIEVAEESGKLEVRLRRLAEQLREEVQFSTDSAVKVGTFLIYLGVILGIGAGILIMYSKLFSRVYTI